MCPGPFHLHAFHSCQATDQRPFLSGHRLHRQTRKPHKRHVGQPRVGLDLFQRHLSWQRPDRLDVDALPSGVIACAVGMGRGHHLDHADDRPFGLRMIEKAQIAGHHLPHEVARLKISDAGPFLAHGTAGDLLIPRPGVGFGFEEPVLHRALVP